MAISIAELAKKIILSESQSDIDQARISLTIYDNIINNISELSKSGVSA
jgi:hypothetical protein